MKPGSAHYVTFIAQEHVCVHIIEKWWSLILIEQVYTHSRMLSVFSLQTCAGAAVSAAYCSGVASVCETIHTYLNGVCSAWTCNQEAVQWVILCTISPWINILELFAKAQLPCYALNDYTAHVETEKLLRLLLCLPGRRDSLNGLHTYPKRHIILEGLQVQTYSKVISYCGSRPHEVYDPRAHVRVFRQTRDTVPIGTHGRFASW